VKKKNKTTFQIENTPIRFVTKAKQDPVIETGDGFKTPGEALKTIVGVKDTGLACDIALSAGAAIASFFPKDDCDKNNIVAQSLYDVGPKDSLEARLIAQSSAVFSHGMKCLAFADRATNTLTRESYTNMAVKLMRVYNETVETLNRYRRGGEQKVTVTHAVLSNQTIVNNGFIHSNGDKQKNRGYTPCHLENVEPNQELTQIDHVVNPPWSTADAVCMEGCLRGQGPRRGD